MNEAVSQKRTLVGEVVSNKMDKTVVVTVTRNVAHPKYGKIMKRSTKFHAHDAENACQLGDTVRITESRPLSKTKTWAVVEILKKAI